VIAQLTGLVARTEASSVILDVNGVGYRVLVPLSVLSSLPETGQKTLLYTTMTVREDDISLYGFRSLEEQAVFQMVTGVSGVGPSVALSMLSVLDAAEVARAIAGNDTKTLTKIPRVGPKLAQRICLELGERMAEFSFTQRLETINRSGSAEENAAFEDVVEALVGLGYSRPDAKKAAERALSAAADKTNTAVLIRESLNLMTSRR
jgi:Holliday junction DNA helicase RuvA